MKSGNEFTVIILIYSTFYVSAQPYCTIDFLAIDPENQGETNIFTAEVQVLTAEAESVSNWFTNANDQIFYIEYSGEICDCWIQLFTDANFEGQDIILHIDYNQTRDGPNDGGLDLRNEIGTNSDCTEFNWSNQVSSYYVWCYNLR